nr:RNA-directed DNA polymerase, eukaryota [Tanacetum cinerariifolium]
MVDGEWVDDPNRVKDEFCTHFAKRFHDSGTSHCRLNFNFLNRLTTVQDVELEAPLSRDEIRKTVWGCGENKSPGSDGFTFEFFRKFWDVVGPDLCIAAEWFFEHCSFYKGCNSSFIALIPKNLDPKIVSDYRPISLIGSLYKVVTKILANRLFMVISDLISDVQTAFLHNRQILDGPFFLNELLSWCKQKNQQAMVFKAVFAKAYDSIRWDFLDDVLNCFGFGCKWRSWIRCSLKSGMASILINGSPTSEFQFHCGLKQGDPLAPYLFILVMEALHLSFSRAINAGIFTGVGVPTPTVMVVAATIGCSIMETPFNYLGIMVGGNMSLIKSWDDTVSKLKSRLSKWKLKTLSIGGRFTLLKLVLGSTPIYSMSLYKVPKVVLHSMEAIRERKIRKRQNRIKTGQKQEAGRSREKFKAVAVEKGRKTEENKKRMAENAYTYQKLFTFKERRKEKGQIANTPKFKHKDQSCPLFVGGGTSCGRQSILTPIGLFGSKRCVKKPRKDIISDDIVMHSFT